MPPRHQPSLLRSYGWQASFKNFDEAARAARRSPEGEDRRSPMKYVYLLESVEYRDQTYIGLTDDLRSRLSEHNRGHSSHTDKYKPWRLVTYVAFSDERKAIEFEHYLKTASGRVFANKRLR